MKHVLTPYLLTGALTFTAHHQQHEGFHHRGLTSTQIVKPLREFKFKIVFLPLFLYPDRVPSNHGAGTDSGSGSRRLESEEVPIPGPNLQVMASGVHDGQ